MCASVGKPMRAASPVSGGASSVASSAPLDNASRRLAAGPLASSVTDWRGIFHSLSARMRETSWAPPKATIPTFLPTRSFGWRTFFCATRLNGNLFNDEATNTRSAPWLIAEINAVPSIWPKWMLPPSIACAPRADPGIMTRSTCTPCFVKKPKSFAAHSGA